MPARCRAARRTAPAPCPSASGRRISVAPSRSRLLPGRRVAEPARVAAVAGQAPEQDLGAGVAELALGAQHEHRQALQRRRAARSAEQASRNSSSAALPDHEAGLQAALGRAEAGEAGPTRAERENVVGQLALQEAWRHRRRARGSRPSRRSGKRRSRERGDGHAPLSSAAMIMRGEGVERSRGRRETMRVWRFAVPAAARRRGGGGCCGLVVAASPARPGRRSGRALDRARHDAARDRRGLGPGRRARPSRSCSTNGSAGRDRRARSAPAATRSAAGTTPIGLLDKMVRGDETLAVVRLIEGWTFRQVRAELAKADAAEADHSPR